MERMPFLSPNKDCSGRTHQGSQRRHQTSLPDPSGYSTYRNISLTQLSDHQNHSIDTPRSVDEKYENVIISPMLQDNSMFNSVESQELLDVTPIEILPLGNLENLTPDKYPSVDLSDLSFSSLNESLECLENLPYLGSSVLDTPSVSRIGHGFPARRREYVLSKRPLGALGVAGTITTPTPSARSKQPVGRTTLFRDGLWTDRDLNSSLQLTKVLENHIERRNTIHFTTQISPPKKVQRWESSPNPGCARGQPDRTPAVTFTQVAMTRREDRVRSLDCVEALNPVFPRKSEPDELKDLNLKSLLSDDDPILSLGCDLDPGPVDRKWVKGSRARLMFSPSKGGSPVVRVKRFAPNILNRRGRARNALMNSSQGSDHFTPSKFLNNPQSSTPVSKRLRDRRNSLLEDIVGSPLKSTPSCKKQIFPDDDLPPLLPLASNIQPMLSFDSTAEDFQSKDLNGYQDEQLFPPALSMFSDSPIQIGTMVVPVSDCRPATDPLPAPEGVDDGSGIPCFLDLVDVLNFEEVDRAVQSLQTEQTTGGFHAQEPLNPQATLADFGLSVDNGEAEYFVCEDGMTYVLCRSGEAGTFGVGGNFMVDTAVGATSKTSLNVTDIVENDLPKTFMKVVCCETTHRRSLVQQAREVLGVAESMPPE